MFAIIDIETCGGKFEFRKGRITEICILKHDGLSVIEKFSTLINPECHISPFFTGLTGITNEMVADAPKFHEIAPKIIEMTEDCIFVAHNVGFDYSFIKDEFRSLGYTYKRDTLCTVRLSRKLIPGQISYSLGHLCAALGIEIFGRHRAEGDAVATSILFDLLIQLKSEHPQYKNMGVEEIMTRRVDKIKRYILNKLPEECGVYYFLNKSNEIIYIGKSNNMYQRAQSHFNSDLKKSKKMLNDVFNVDFVITGSEMIALLLESEEIKKHKPKYNRQRKSEEFTHSIDYFYDNRGILNFKICEEAMSENTLLTFNSYGAARDKLETMIENFQLCLRYTGLTSEESVCFDHQLKKCNGICAGEETPEDYNKRAVALVNTYLFENNDFVILDRGRNADEYSAILVENKKYKGFGYIDRNEQISHPLELKGFISERRYYPDCDTLIRHFLKEGRKKVVSLDTANKQEDMYFDLNNY